VSTHLISSLRSSLAPSRHLHVELTIRSNSINLQHKLQFAVFVFSDEVCSLLIVYRGYSNANTTVY